MMLCVGPSGLCRKLSALNVFPGNSLCQSCQCFRFYRKTPDLRPSLRLYDFNVKSYYFYARRLSYQLCCIDEWLLANIISMIFIRQYGANENDFHFCFQHKYGKLKQPPRSKSETVIKFKRPKYDKKC